MYIFHPEELTAEQREAIQESISESTEMQILANWYKELKQEIDTVDQRKKKVRPVSSAIELTSNEYKKRKQYTFRLAAKTPAEPKKRAALKTISTFISKEEGVIVRFLKSDEDSDIQIHAISERIALDDVALLTVPGLRELLISKPGGIFELNVSELVTDDIRNWKNCTLFIPTDRLDLLIDEHSGDVFLDSHQTNKDELTVTLEEKPTCFLLHVETSERFSIQKAVASSGGKEYLLGIEKTVIEIPKSIMQGRLTSVFFFN